MGTFKEIVLEHWSEFPQAMETLACYRKRIEEANKRRLSDPLFRGLGNYEWRLQTTLERSPDVERSEEHTLISYYRRAERSKPAVESLTGKVWDNIPDWLAFKALLQDRTSEWINHTLGTNSAIYSYPLYLRHHGYPSPLLDWTASPFVAATFAFDAKDKNASHVGVYAWFRDSMQISGSYADLFVVGPYIRTHQRHYFQQSRYSLFLQLQWENNGDQIKYDYGFLPHHSLVEDNPNNDLVALIRIPTVEYRAALMELDTMNLNPHSLYGSEESLIRTIARRELLFRDKS